MSIKRAFFRYSCTRLADLPQTIESVYVIGRGMNARRAALATPRRCTASPILKAHTWLKLLVDYTRHGPERGYLRLLIPCYRVLVTSHEILIISLPLRAQHPDVDSRGSFLSINV